MNRATWLARYAFGVIAGWAICWTLVLGGLWLASTIARSTP